MGRRQGLAPVVGSSVGMLRVHHHPGACADEAGHGDEERRGHQPRPGHHDAVHVHAGAAAGQPIPGKEATAQADPRGGTCLAGGGRRRSLGNAWPQLGAVGRSPSLAGWSGWAEYQ